MADWLGRAKLDVSDIALSYRHPDVTDTSLNPTAPLAWPSAGRSLAAINGNIERVLAGNIERVLAAITDATLKAAPAVGSQTPLYDLDAFGIMSPHERNVLQCSC